MANPAASPSTSLLIEWANEEAGWVRQIATDLLSSRSPATDKDVDRYLDLLLREKGLSSSPPPVVPLIPQSAIAGSAVEPLRLSSLKITGGVNALKDGEELHFGTRLTVIYGENGSGKSGYVRVLKRAAGVRSAERILPNIHKVTTGSPSAIFKCAEGSSPERDVDWKDQEGVPPFTQIAAFDAKAVSAHLDEDLTYVYTPGELALFPLVQDAIERTRTRLSERITASTDARNPFIVQFKRGTAIYPIVEKLGAASDLSALKALATLSDEDKAHRAQVQAEVEALKAADSKAQLKLAEDQAKIVSSARSALAIGASFDAKEYHDALSELEKASRKNNEVSVAAFEKSGIPKVLGDEWRAFIDAGDKYLKDAEAESYPNQGDQCAYCRQPLFEAGIDLIQKYREFSNGETRRAVASAELKLSTVMSAIAKLDVEAIVVSVSTEVAAGRGEVLRPLLAPLEELREFRSAVMKSAPNLPDVASVAAAVDSVTELDAKITETIAGLKAKTTERETLLTSRQSELDELEARVVLEALWVPIQKKVLAAKWADEASVVSRAFQGILRSLTEQAKAATQTLLNTSFETLFVDEARALRAPTVILEFPGSKGQTLRRKVVGEHRPGEVLSEGEQKVIALADFLAETRVRQPAGPVVFDDPVNSLDYRRAQEVADRILALSKTHQVIVFTHSVMFASMLLENSDKTSSKYVDIRNDGGPGLVSIGTHPRTDSVKNLLGRMNAAIAAAKKATGPAQEALIYQGFAILRALTEMVSEHHLLKAVSERYRANVRVETLEKINIPDLEECIKKTVECYRKACRYIEAHSQPMDHLGVTPTLSELESEFAIVQDVMKRHS